MKSLYPVLECNPHFALDKEDGRTKKALLPPHFFILDFFTSQLVEDPAGFPKAEV